MGGFKDRLIGLAPESLKPPIKPETYDGFLATLQELGAKRVAATPGRKRLTNQVDPDTGASATGWGYQVVFDGVGRQGRRIRYELDCAYRVSQDVDRRNNFGGRIVGEGVVLGLEEAWLMTTYVTADTLLNGIKEQMPQCETALMNSGKPFTADQYQDLRAQAQQGPHTPLE